MSAAIISERSRSLCHLLSVCLSVTFVHPTQAIEMFLRHFVPWPSLTFR